MLEPIDVKNGLRQGFCMAPVLFNLYTCLAVERWLARVKDNEEVGITTKFKYHRKLSRRYTANACEKKLTECQFADDAALLSSTRSGVETASGGLKKRWRDVMRKGLKDIGVSEEKWFDEAVRSRAG